MFRSLFSRIAANQQIAASVEPDIRQAVNMDRRINRASQWTNYAMLFGMAAVPVVMAIQEDQKQHGLSWPTYIKRQASCAWSKDNCVALQLPDWRAMKDRWFPTEPASSSCNCPKTP